MNLQVINKNLDTQIKTFITTYLNKLNKNENEKFTLIFPDNKLGLILKNKNLLTFTLIEENKNRGKRIRIEIFKIYNEQYFHHVSFATNFYKLEIKPELKDISVKIRTILFKISKNLPDNSSVQDLVNKLKSHLLIIKRNV